MEGAADRLLGDARSRFGDDMIRAGGAGPAGLSPVMTIEPASPAAVGDILAWASERALVVIPVGSGTKLDWGQVPGRTDVMLSLRRLARVVEHRYGDLTATVEAGANLASVNTELASRGQWIPLDPCFGDAATIGGIVATNDSGPRRLRHGAPRDLIIGVEFARADGRLAKAGGTVVKNVAGYDLSKLLAGSFGALAVIVSATFKLAPVAPASRTVVIDLSALEGLGPILKGLSASQLTASAIEIELPPLRVLVRFEAVQDAAVVQAEAAVELASSHGAAARIVADEEEQTLWRTHGARPWDESGAVLKVGVLPTEVPTALMAAESLMREHRTTGEAVGRGSLGVLLLRTEGPVEAQAKFVNGLRASVERRGGYVTLLRGSPQVRALTDAAGGLSAPERLLQAVKLRFDPGAVLRPATRT